MLTILGATGNLAPRMLLPSLYGLHCDGVSPASMRILSPKFYEQACAALARHGHSWRE